MPRQERTKSGTGIYHVMLRGINKQDIFEDDEDYLQMTSCLQGLTERYDENGVTVEPLCTIYSYCLMSNHLHLLIREQEEDISSVMKRLGVAYAYYFNKKYQRNGHLFQDRFRSEPVNTMDYFVTLMRYIHQNPLKAGLECTAEPTLLCTFSSFSLFGNKLFCIFANRNLNLYAQKTKREERNGDLPRDDARHQSPGYLRR